MRNSTRLMALLGVAALAACSDSPTEPAPDFLRCDRVVRYSIGSTASGRLASGDCRLQEDNSYVDYYRFELSSQRTVTITMRSSDFDSFLFLLDDDGELVAFDDDGDPETQFGSRVSITLTPGQYYIGANSYAQGETGEYSLSSN